MSPHPPYERESSFVGVRIRVPLAPAFLVASDTGLRPCPPPPPPYSMSLIVRVRYRPKLGK